MVSEVGVVKRLCLICLLTNDFVLLVYLFVLARLHFD